MASTSKALARFLVSIIIAASVATPTQAEKSTARASVKYGFGFAPVAADREYKKYKKKYPYCVKVAASNFKAATKYNKGVASFPKASSTVSKANKVCKALGLKAIKGGVTLKLAAAGTARSSVRVSTDTSSRCSVRISSTGARRVICEGLAATTSATFDLPNSSTLIETVTPGSSSSVVSQIGSRDTCAYQFVSAAGVVSCLSGLASISYIDTTPLSSQGSLATFQALSSGDVVFIGGATEGVSGKIVFKLSSSGILSQLASVESDAETFTKFLVEADDRIVVTGNAINSELSASVPFVRIISSSGVVATVSSDTRTVGGAAISFLTKDSDGRALIGLTNVSQTVADVSTARIVRVASDSSALENIISSTAASPIGEAIDAFCTGATGSLSAFCDYGGTYITSAYATSSALFAVARSHTTSSPRSLPAVTSLIKYRPTLQQISLTNISYPLYVSGVGKYLIISGFNSSDAALIVKYDTETTEETIIASDVLAPLTFRYSQRISAILGFGNRVSDLNQMIYQIPFASGVLGTPVVTELPLREATIGSIRFAY